MKLRHYTGIALSALGLACTMSAQAQLCQNPDKFLGNITTRGQVNYNGVEFVSLWNQLTPENETKWESVEGNRDNMNWSACDRLYNYCKQNGIPFKFHTLVWGSQYPRWMDNLGKKAQYEEIVEWMDEAARRYPDLDMIDVVNEAVAGHAPAPYKDALGGDGITGYDWIVKSFELAHERWPNAILIYNDYNTFEWQKNEFIHLVKTLRDAGAPIDAYGCQSHDLGGINISTFKNAMTEIQNQLKMPMYSTEYDIDNTDDQHQLKQYRDQITYMWERSYVAGITLWGYVYGCTWVNASGIVRDGVDRPAMTWLKEYMATDAAKTAKSPFPGRVKEASIYVRPECYRAPVNEETTITVDATMRTKTIKRVLLYKDNNLVSTMTEAPYEYSFVPDKKGHINLRAVVETEDGERYERLGGMYVVGQRIPYNGEAAPIPGVLEAEEFDRGGEGISFHDTDSKDEGKSGFRDDNEGVDIISIADGYAVGYTAAGEWLEFTVDVDHEARYTIEAVVSAGNDGAEITISTVDGTEVTMIPPSIKVPNTGSWDTYTSVTKKLLKTLKPGRQILRLTIEGAYANIDKLRIYDTAGITDVRGDRGGLYDVYTTTGIHVGSIECDDETEIYTKVGNLTGSNGVYVVRDIRTNESRLIKAQR